MGGRSKTYQYEMDSLVRLLLLQDRLILPNDAETGVSGRNTTYPASGFSGGSAKIIGRCCVKRQRIVTNANERASFTAFWVGDRGARIDELCVVGVSVVTP